MNRRNFIKSSLFITTAGLLSVENLKRLNVFPYFDDYEIKLLKEKLSYFSSISPDLSLSEIIQRAGESFLNTPYMNSTLDENPEAEELIIKLSGFDCVTFVENTIVFSRLIKKEKLNVDDFKSELANIRYRNGKIDGYTSRLHYFTDWIFDNSVKGIVEDITKSIGGIPYDKKINFMSSHYNLYKQLNNNESNIEKIREIERDLYSRNTYFIPKSKVNNSYDCMKTGDIIAITTDIEGLDVSHTGFIYKENSKTKFMHASLTDGKVIISEKELKQYLLGNKKQTGIIVTRPLDI